MSTVIALDFNKAHIYATALNMLVKANEQRRLGNKDLNGVNDYVSSNPMVIQDAQKVLKGMPHADAGCILVDDDEIFAIQTALMDLQGLVAQLNSSSYCVILGCTQQQLIDYMDEIHRLFERTPRYRKAMKKHMSI